MEKLYVIYGNRAEEMARAIMERMDIARELASLKKENPLICLKPNLVVAQPAHWGATTDPGLARGIIGYLQEHGYTNIAIMESAWVGDDTAKAFDVCGYRQIAAEFAVPLVDLKQDRAVKLTVDGLELEICARMLAVDYLINLPVLKAHCQTRLTCALKNLKGCIPDREKRRFHRLGLHRPIACLNKAIRSHLTVVDGIVGDLTYEGGGTPVRMDCVIAGRDPVMIDAFAAELIGYRAEEIEYIGLAEHLGVGSAAAGPESIVYLNRRQEARFDEPSLASKEVDYLQRWIREKQACSPCYAALVYALRRLKESGQLKKLPPVCIGQGWKEKKEKAEELGVGACTKGCRLNVPGCPPRAGEIVAALQSWIGK
ncbi:MAG TPA: DUF362 domain-containing protein [Bacillota bacterium]|nr:DUF362 domain-containing protein [Bacillota bacterium]